MPVPGEETTDEVLAVRAVAGDEPAFEDLVRRYQARVYRLAVRLTGNDGDAQDALQETFLQVYRSLGGFRGEARFSTWLYRVATNAALGVRRLVHRMARIFQASLLLEEADQDLTANRPTRLPEIARFFVSRYVEPGYDPAEDPGYGDLIRQIVE